MGLIENNIWHIPLKTVDYKYVFIFMRTSRLPLSIFQWVVDIPYENVAIEHDIKCIDDI